jgi:hypothetical protein
VDVVEGVGEAVVVLHTAGTGEGIAGLRPGRISQCRLGQPFVCARRVQRLQQSPRVISPRHVATERKS